ncbi:hypothetical protein BaRGS_00038625 [Batillaria attramentaria]|uniref:NERD domain-containing protein n=1 Tax=Batillaria attramentaria TaxID=370345 RepID=A0ABD0J5B9_9CAEN
MAKKFASNLSTRADLEDELRHFVQSCYPDLHHRTYCVPPCIMNRVPYVRRVVAGQPVLLTSYTPGADQEPPVSLQQQDTVRQPQSLWEREIHRKRRPSGAEKQVQASPFPSPQQNIDRPPQTLWAREFRPNSKPLRVMDCDVRDDFAQQHVLHCLHKLGQKRQEVMFIISQLMFGNYLNKPLHEKFPSVLPRPADLPRRFIDRADCDVLIVHQNHGILLGEIKSVGFNSAGLTPEEFEKVLAKRIKKAVKQLHKSEMVVQHIFQDLAPDLKVRHTIILPYVTSTQLQRVLENDSKLANVSNKQTW